jgi:hypothetical protein
MPAKAVFEVAAGGAGDGSFEIEVGATDVAVWLWSGATAEVFHDGALVASREYAVPPRVDIVRRMLFPPGDPRSDEPKE